MKKRKTVWRLWAKALGQKATKNDTEADHIAHIRTIIFATYLVTNVFIVAGVIRHWNDNLNRDTGFSSYECQRQSQKQDHIIPLVVSPFHH